MTEAPAKKNLEDSEIPTSETEVSSESNVALLKLGLFILILCGIFMLMATAWYMSKRFGY